MKNKNFWIAFGLVLFIFGATSLVLQAVGVRFAFLSFLEAPGMLFGFLIKIFMIVGGILAIVLAKTDWAEEQKLLEED